MRVIKGKSIIYMLIMLILPSAMAIFAYSGVSKGISDPFYGPMLGLISALISFYAVLVFVYRLYILYLPFALGELEPGSLDEERWKAYTGIWLFFFYPVILPRWIPTPLTGLLYQTLGAKVGVNSFFRRNYL